MVYINFCNLFSCHGNETNLDAKSSEAIQITQCKIKGPKRQLPNFLRNTGRKWKARTFWTKPSIIRPMCSLLRTGKYRNDLYPPSYVLLNRILVNLKNQLTLYASLTGPFFETFSWWNCPDFFCQNNGGQNWQTEANFEVKNTNFQSENSLCAEASEISGVFFLYWGWSAEKGSA